MRWIGNPVEGKIKFSTVSDIQDGTFKHGNIIDLEDNFYKVVDTRIEKMVYFGSYYFLVVYVEPLFKEYK